MEDRQEDDPDDPEVDRFWRLPSVGSDWAVVHGFVATRQGMFAPDSGYEVEIRGEEYLILRERDVHAVASLKTEGQTGLYL